MEYGKVVWFNAEKGFGFIQRGEAQEDVFVHWSGISGDGYLSLEKDQDVSFDVVPVDDGKQKAVNVTVIYGSDAE